MFNRKPLCHWLVSKVLRNVFIVLKFATPVKLIYRFDCIYRSSSYSILKVKALSFQTSCPWYSDKYGHHRAEQVISKRLLERKARIIKREQVVCINVYRFQDCGINLICTWALDIMNVDIMNVVHIYCNIYCGFYCAFIKFLLFNSLFQATLYVCILIIICY